MKFHSALVDRKIMGVNCLIEMTIGEYLEFAPSIIDKNEYQRTKVKTSAKTYELLERDMLIGCIIPPIILSLTGEASSKIDVLVKECIESGIDNALATRLEQEISAAFADKQVMILDGLQRTHTINSIIDNKNNDRGDIDVFLKSILRFEVYLGLSRQGILYRMLTLNTGQTPMSFRHQLEILYKDYIDGVDLPEHIKVFKEVDEARARGISKYKYADVVDMFYAFSTGSPMPYDKQALVGALKEMEFLENFEYNEKGDDLTKLLILHDKVTLKIAQISYDWAFDAERVPRGVKPFGVTVESIFTKPQAMAGFGAECKRMIDHSLVENLDEISNLIDGLHFSGEPVDSMDLLTMSLFEISSKAKKIGDAQRLYFQFGFRALLTEAFGVQQDMTLAWVKGQETYTMMYGA